MRSHSRIIDEAGGPQGLHDALGFTDRLITVRSWRRRDSIPAEHWMRIADLKLATLDELAAAAATRSSSQSKNRAAA